MENKIIEEQSTDEIIQAIDNDQNAIPYRPLSKLPSLGTVMPLNLSGETLQAQYDFSEEIPDVDAYLVQKLNYTSKIAMATGGGVPNGGLGAEQADAVAFAIRQIEKGKGMILADMAGIGKGRVNASLLRYAYNNGYIPVFITEKPNLFSAIYRDIKDIGGIKTKSGGGADSGMPFIINGYKSGGYEKGYDEKGKKTRLPKPSETGIVRDGKEIITAPKQEIVSDIINSGKLPKKYDYIFMTYSQISGKFRNKIDYLLELANNNKLLLCLDECHNASGTKSTTGKRMMELVQAASGVLFSSATFSKRPDNMFIYSLKTDIMDSPLGTDRLIDVINKGGERLIENLASSLVASGQMIRRERTFENCDVVYSYMSEEDKQALFVKYDNALRLYKNIQSYFSDKNRTFVEAKKKAVERFAKEKKVKFCDEEKPIDKFSLKEWTKRNLGKYYLKNFTAGDVKKNQFQFIETLLFAIKAEFVVNQVVGNAYEKNPKNKMLGQLNDNQLENIRVEDKVKFKSNRKPVIAVRNTLEGIYYSLGLEDGSELDKADFSKYVYALAMDAIEGSVTLKEIVKMKEGDEEDEDKQKGKEIKDDLMLIDEDFEDGGETFKQLLKSIDDVDLDIPLSPIDYIIQKIESTPRPTWDMEYGEGSKYFRVGEVTGRKFNLFQMKDENGDFINRWKLSLNKKDKNKAVTFNKFNQGIIDVLLINESGSTGEDAHSSSKFKDQRPRVMIIHQVELDVNTEVQKRGRINRTGMVNYPTYVYAISRIPSEIRRLLMLVRKLRSLDANTTGNQKQSQKLSTIRDGEGNEIEDVINKYGDECLEEFLNDIANSKYSVYSAEDLSAVYDQFAIQGFIRKLELAFCLEQEYFFNTINVLYTKLKNELIEAGTYDLETNLIDLKAAIKTRVLISKGIDTNPFNSPVYEEDDYVLAEDKPYTLEKVEDLLLNLSQGEDPKEYYSKFVRDYKKYSEEHIKEVIESVEKPDYEGMGKEERKKAKEDYELRLLEIRKKAEKEYNRVLHILDSKRLITKGRFEIYTEPSSEYKKADRYYIQDFVIFEETKNSEGKWYLVDEGWIKSEQVETTSNILIPNEPVLIPSVIDECYEMDEDGKPKVPTKYNSARFIGVRLLKTAKEKYSPMNIELVFCQLSGRPKLILKPTIKGSAVLDWILIKSKYIEKSRKILIDNWQIDMNRREIIRLLTGNILGAYSFAMDRVKQDSSFSSVIKFLKFTTADNTSIRYGIKLTMHEFEDLKPENVEVEYPLNSSDLIKDLRSTTQEIKSANIYDNFVLEKGWRGVKVFIFGGKRADAESTKKRLYYSAFYDDGKIYSLLDSMGITYYRGSYYDYRKIGAKQKVYLRCLEIRFGDLNEKQGENLQKLFEYVYSVEPFNIRLTGVEGSETITDKPDIYIPSEKDEEIEQIGEYKYESLRPYTSIKEEMKNFGKFDKYEKTSDFGTIYTKSRVKVGESRIYGLIPLNHNVKDMVYDSFELITNDTERLKFKDKIEKAIAEKKSSFDVGEIVYETLNDKVPNLNVIFGYGGQDLDFLGDVFIKYSKGDIEIPEKKKKEKEKEVERERAKRPLDIDTAQEYVTNLLFKIKKR